MSLPCRLKWYVVLKKALLSHVCAVVPDLQSTVHEKKGGTVPSKAVDWALQQCDRYIRSRNHEDIDKVGLLTHSSTFNPSITGTRAMLWWHPTSRLMWACSKICLRYWRNSCCKCDPGFTNWHLVGLCHRPDWFVTYRLMLMFVCSSGKVFPRVSGTSCWPGSIRCHCEFYIIQVLAEYISLNTTIILK